MPPTQDSQTTFKPNLTCILLSARARYIMSNPDEIPCIFPGSPKKLPGSPQEATKLFQGLKWGQYESRDNLLFHHF